MKKNPLSPKFYAAKLKSIEPVHLMLLGISLVVAVFFGIQYINTPESKISLYYDDEVSNVKDLSTVKSASSEAARIGEDDPNVRLSMRFFEANGIANGLLHFCLYNYFTQNQRIPSNTINLLNEFLTSDLKPPYVLNIDENGRFITRRGVYFVQYRPNPFSIAVLSSGENSDEDGGVFLLRMPDYAANQIYKDKLDTPFVDLATVYVAPDKDTAKIPNFFSEANHFVELGWRIEPLRMTDVSAEKLEAVKKLLERNQ